MSLLITHDSSEAMQEGGRPHCIREVEGQFSVPIRLLFSPTFDLSIRRRFFGKLLFWIGPSNLSSGGTSPGGSPGLYVLVSNLPTSDCPFPIVSAEGSETELDAANR